MPKQRMDDENGSDRQIAVVPIRVKMKMHGQWNYLRGQSIMTVEEARKILVEWGKYLETCHARLWTIFFLGEIPESFLPYQIATLEEATNVMGRFYFDMGDYKMSESIKTTIDPAFLYRKDEEAIEHFFRVINMPGLDAKDIMIDKVREYRNRVSTA